MKIIKNEINLFLLAVMFYTRIPCPAGVKYSPEALNRSTKYFPVMGWIVGGIAGLVFTLSLIVFPREVSIILSMISSILITGAFHEDGLADFCDGFGGGWTKEKILEIMKDSRLGSYGAIGLFLALLLKYTLLVSFPVAVVPLVLFIAHSLSRLIAASFIYTHSYARADEESKVKPIAKGIGHFDMLITAILGFLPLALLRNLIFVIVLVPLLIAKTIIGRYFNKWLGGFTGDCLGATQQISELIIYLTFLVIWKFL